MAGVGYFEVISVVFATLLSMLLTIGIESLGATITEKGDS